MKKLIIVLISLLFINCEYIPRKTYMIKTIDGEILKLSCPVIDAGRSIWTYTVDGDCILVK